MFLPDTWDCVVTCYFIDTAHNVIAYIENISKILKPGGYWINLGKLKATTCINLRCNSKGYYIFYGPWWNKFNRHMIGRENKVE